MKSKLCCFVMAAVSLGLSSKTTAQGAGDYPEIGQQVPDFELKHVYNYSQKSITNTQLEGKPVILYFWSRFCAGAVRSLAQVNKLYEELGGTVELFIIGGEAAGVENGYLFPGQEPGMDKLKGLYDELSAKLHFSAPVLFDVELYQRFVVHGVPYVVWIDKNGVVQAVNGSISKEKVELFLQGHPFFFKDASYRYTMDTERNRYDPSKPLPFEGNEDSNAFLHRSVLAPYSRGVPGIPFAVNQVCKDSNTAYSKGRFEGQAPLKNLYKSAYFGYVALIGEERNNPEYKNDYNQLLYEVKDKTPFTAYSYESGKHVYVYSLSMPPEKTNEGLVMGTMQHDLKDYFGYDVQVEQRTLPYWSLGITEKGKRKLKTKGGAFEENGDGFTRIGFRNVSVDQFVKSLFYLVASDKELPFINDTKFPEHIDIAKAPLVWQDFDDIKRFLKEQGFTLEKKEKDFRVIVISDPVVE